jgi:hypothetical protein
MGQVSIKGKITEDIPSINGIAGHGQIDTSYDWEYPESNLSDYVFTLESSGGGAYADVAEYEDPADPTVNRSNIWVTNHTNVATGSTPTFSWTPDIVEIPDFYSANEMVIVGNDIYIVFRWAGYNKFLLAKGYYLAYNAGATNDTTGQPFSEIWPVDDGGPGAGDITHPDMYDEDGKAYVFASFGTYQNSCNQLIKFVNCAVDEVAEEITFDSYERKTLWGVHQLHANSRAENHWVLSERNNSYGKFSHSILDASFVVVPFDKPLSETKVYVYNDMFNGSAGMDSSAKHTVSPMIKWYPKTFPFSQVVSRFSRMSYQEAEFGPGGVVRYDDFGNTCPFVGPSLDAMTATGKFGYFYGQDINETQWFGHFTPNTLMDYSPRQRARLNYFAEVPADNVVPEKSEIEKKKYGEVQSRCYQPAICRVNLDNGEVQTVTQIMSPNTDGGKTHLFTHGKYIYSVVWDRGVWINRYDLDNGTLTSKFLCAFESGRYRNSTSTYVDYVDIVGEINAAATQFEGITMSADNIYAELAAIGFETSTNDIFEGDYVTFNRGIHSAGADLDGNFAHLHFDAIPQVMKIDLSDLSFDSWQDPGQGGPPTDDFCVVGDYVFIGDEGGGPSIDYYHKDNVTTDNGEITTLGNAPFGVFHSNYKF